MNTPRDPDFDDLMDSADHLFARYKSLPNVEPPRELDIAILAKAREAVARPRPNRLRWLVPLASVATLALAAGLGWRVFEAEQRNAASAPTSAPNAANEEHIIEFELLDLPNRDAERKEMANSPPEPVTTQRAEKAPTAPVAAMVPPAAASAPMPEAMPDPMPADAAPGLVDDQTREQQAAPLLKSRDYSEPHRQADHAGLSQPPEADRRKAAGMGIGQSGSSKSGTEQSNDLAAAKADSDAEEILEPDEWIQKIRDLRIRRRFTDVRQELAEFRRTYPNYPVPADLATFIR